MTYTVLQIETEFAGYRRLDDQMEVVVWGDGNEITLTIEQWKKLVREMAEVLTILEKGKKYGKDDQCNPPKVQIVEDGGDD